mgnify:CR=1 FL=1|tara:strand:+ start:1713 stop:2057 length:345 start_codon:yes stop_codon:yes gene_type:complete
MEEHFVPYDEAKTLKELGFDEPCLAYYDLWERLNNILNHDGDRLCDAPVFSQAFDWFREKYQYRSYIRQDVWNNTCDVEIADDDGNGYVTIGSFDNYEEAKLGCLRKLIEIITV